MSMRKPSFERECPDCSATYTVDDSYSDEAYTAHRLNEPQCVCIPCYEKFCGLTIDELIGHN
jgi:hypothetical protein